jgi:ubiquinone/menaquinone biosynthesis C-methylase UbiE
MLSRLLEPEVMDSAEEARDYDAMDHSMVNRLFVADFLAFWRGDGPMLDVGTGTAQIPIELCRQSPKAQVTAIDLAEHMLALGRENVCRAGFADRINLERIDAKHMPYASAAYAAVISNSIVHHIPEPKQVLAEMVRVTRPGGVLFVRDLLRPSDQGTLARIVQTYAGDANAHQQKMFGDSLHAALSLAELRDMIASLGLDPAHVRQTSDRHWTWQTSVGSDRIHAVS